MLSEREVFGLMYSPCSVPPQRVAIIPTSWGCRFRGVCRVGRWLVPRKGLVPGFSLSPGVSLPTKTPGAGLRERMRPL